MPDADLRAEFQEWGSGLATFYAGLSGLVGIVVFLAGWVYAIATYGFLVGVALGWIPAAIVGVVSAVLWPILLGLIVVAVQKGW